MVIPFQAELSSRWSGICTNNPRIKYTLLSILFSILFIFTAFYNPLEVQADDVVLTEDSPAFGQVINLSDYSANEIDESSEEEAGYLYWAASGDRCGVMFYVVDQIGQVQAHGVLLDEAGRYNYGSYGHLSNLRYSLDYRGSCWKRYGVAALTEYIKYVPNVSTVYYSGGWQAKGSDAMAYLTSSVPGVTLEIDGVSMECPYWAYYVAQTGESGKEALKELAHPETKWQVFVEPVSVNYLYTENHFDRQVDNTVTRHDDFAAGSPMPKGTWVDDKYKPDVYLATSFNLLGLSNMLKDGGTQYTYKFYNKQFPYSMCLREDAEMANYAGGSYGGHKYFKGIVPPNEIPRLYRSNPVLGDGLAMAAIDISGFSLPPIHTFDGTNTPGNTEVPKEEKGTAGECVIKKLYYTETLNADGTVNTEADPEYYSFERRNTTAYVSIDNEDGYEIESWRITSDDVTFTRKEHWHNIGSGWGDISAQVVRMADAIATDGANKYLYVLYKKVVVLPEPAEFEFELQESQITKRVTFLESTKTAALVTNSFSWTSPAHTTTACQSHGGYGHHRWCTKVWDTAPVTGVAHTCTDSCSVACSTDHEHTSSCPQACAIVWDVAPVTGVAHTHSNPCWDTPCSSFGFTDNSVKLGITLDQNSVNKAVVSTHNATVYNDPTVNTIHANIGHGAFTRTNPAVDTQSKNSYNFVSVLFRGNDKLTLAHWKNAATGKYMGYLTGISLDPAYNFKAANTPQGTRKAGEAYLETTSTKFINSSPDVQTTYGGTVGAHGKCEDDKTFAFTNSAGTSSDFTISDIKVNIKVFWANGIGPSSSATLPSTQVAGSASFYPYIRMRYDNNTQNDVPIYVLGQRQRSATFYDYASVSISGGDSVITVNSNQYYLR